jgi:hypothetical protein
VNTVIDEPSRRVHLRIPRATRFSVARRVRPCWLDLLCRPPTAQRFHSRI